jgi:hypothetical protein
LKILILEFVQFAEKRLNDKGKNMAKAISMSRNKGLAKMAKTAKGKEAVKKMGFNPNRMVAKKGGRAKKRKR